MGTLTYILYIAVVLTIVNEVRHFSSWATVAKIYEAMCQAIFYLIVLGCSLACRCPPRSKVPGYKQTCTSDYDCKNGMVCCPNWSNTKSCVYPAPFAKYKLNRQKSAPWGFVKYVANNRVGASFKFKGPRKYCDGVNCMQYEVCKRDHSKRRSCQLP